MVDFQNSKQPVLHFNKQKIKNPSPTSCRKEGSFFYFSFSNFILAAGNSSVNIFLFESITQFRPIFLAVLNSPLIHFLLQVCSIPSRAAVHIRLN